MRIAIIALGSRGDVQPYVALGVGLKAAGHVVRLVTHENFAPLAAAHGLEARPVRGDVQAVAESEAVSYTHLDVYKRQLYFHREGDGVLTGMSNPGQAVGFDAVSYTHLDVYKRQPQWSNAE